MTEQTQIYKGKFPDQRPTQEQLELLRRMGVKESVIQSLTRQQAFKLIRAIMVRFYTDRFEKQHKPKIGVYIQW